MNNQPLGVEDKPRQSKNPACREEGNAVQGIQKQVSDIQHQLQAMTVALNDTAFKAQRGRPGRKVPVRIFSLARGDQRKGSAEVIQRETFFCYRCGEDGHIARRCMAAEDTSKVISKLISALKKQTW